MPETERFREAVHTPVTADLLARRAEAGWRLVALEWERDVEDAAPGRAPQRIEEIPYGLRISADCRYLVEDPDESAVIVAALELIVDDCPLSQVAEDLNRRGHRTRSGKDWSAAAVFNLLPRMIEAGPRVFSSRDWAARRRRLSEITGPRV